MKLSIVATLYQSALYVEEFCQRATASARDLVGDDYEIILVNDGSPDNSLEVAIGLMENDSHIVIVDLSRNFGHHKAMMTGLSYAKGDKVYLLDSDLEESPEWLLEFDNKLQGDACDVVYGVQAERKGGFVERFSGDGFYTVLDFLTDLNLPRNIVTARLMTRRYVDALLLHRDQEVFIAGLWHITGFTQVPHVVKKLSSSETTYTFRRKASVLVNSATSFSNFPLKAIFYIGMIVFLTSLIYISYLVAMKLFWAQTLGGWTSIMASIWLLGGMIISFIGVIGIYLSKVFSEVKNRPYTIVRRVYGKS